MKAYHPIREKILVRVEKNEAVSAGGIVLVQKESEVDHKEEGIIIELGSRVFYDTPGVEKAVKVGDRVLFSRYAGKTCKRERDIEYRVMKDIDILCVITEEEDKLDVRN